MKNNPQHITKNKIAYRSDSCRIMSIPASYGNEYLNLIPQDKMSFWKTNMVPVGEYNMKQNKVQGKMNYPYYGEHIMSGRAIWLGYWGSKYPSK